MSYNDSYLIFVAEGTLGYSEKGQNLGTFLETEMTKNVNVFSYFEDGKTNVVVL